MCLCSCTHTHAAQWLYIYLKQNGLGNTSILKNTPGIHNGPRKKEVTNTVVISEAHIDVSALHFLVARPQGD